MAFLPLFLLKFEPFLAIFNQFLRPFMTPSKIDLPQSKWVRSSCLPEKGTPHPPLFTVKLWNCDEIALH
jgi:hypothetical protein